MVGDLHAADARYHPQLCSLPPTEDAFRHNVRRAHFQLAIWRCATKPDPPNLDPLDHGWVKCAMGMVPIMVTKRTPIAPPELLKLTKCACKSETRACQSSRCSCREMGMACTVFCACKGDTPACHNPCNANYNETE